MVNAMRQFQVKFEPNYLGRELGLTPNFATVTARGTRDALSKGHQRAVGDLTWGSVDFRTVKHPDAQGLATAITHNGDIVGQFTAKANGSRRVS